MSSIVLIDADNIKATRIGMIKTTAARFGRIVGIRLYGDFSSSHLSTWKPVVLQNGIIAVQQHPCRKGKNATDIAMVIDAMDLMHASVAHTFILVSGDGDFQRLALRLKESGKHVIGIGNADVTSSAFANSCDEFVYLSDDTESPPVPRAGEEGDMRDPEPLDLLRKAVMNAADIENDEDGWANLSMVGTQVRRLDPTFDCRTVSSRVGPRSPVGRMIRLFQLLQDEFQVKQVEHGYMVRLSCFAAYDQTSSEHQGVVH